MQNVSYLDEALTKFEFCWKNLVKLFSIKLYESPPGDSRAITSVQTDRHYEVSSSFSWIFCYGRPNALVCENSDFVCKKGIHNCRWIDLSILDPRLQCSSGLQSILKIVVTEAVRKWLPRSPLLSIWNPNVLLNAIVYFLSWKPSCVPYTNIHYKNTSRLAVLTAVTEVSGFHLHVHNNNTVEFDVQVTMHRDKFL